MERWQLVLYLATLLYSYGSIAQESEEEGEWTYKDQRQWGGECDTGNRQSPINLDCDQASKEWTYLPFNRYHSVVFLDYKQRANGTFTNTGHTVQMDLEYNDPFKSPRTLVSTENDTEQFILSNIHWHWPSDHAINGKRYDLEMHMVHRSADGNILVLGYMFHKKRVCWRERNAMKKCMADVEQFVSRLAEPNSTFPVYEFAPRCLMPMRLDQCDYFQYEGSLTTPPCTEGVTWLVYKEPLCITTQEMDAFNNVRGSDGTRMAGNARDLQDVNGRTITYHSCFYSWFWWF